MSKIHCIFSNTPAEGCTVLAPSLGTTTPQLSLSHTYSPTSKSYLNPFKA